MPRKTTRATRSKKQKKAEPEIVKSIQHGDRTYGPGDEDAFRAAKGVTKESLQRLEEKGAIRHFTSGSATSAAKPGEGEGERLPGEETPDDES